MTTLLDATHPNTMLLNATPKRDASQHLMLLNATPLNTTHPNNHALKSDAPKHDPFKHDPFKHDDVSAVGSHYEESV